MVQQTPHDGDKDSQGIKVKDRLTLNQNMLASQEYTVQKGDIADQNGNILLSRTQLIHHTSS